LPASARADHIQVSLNRSSGHNAASRLGCKKHTLFAENDYIREIVNWGLFLGLPGEN